MKSSIIAFFGITLLVHLLIEGNQCRITFYHPDLVSHYLHLRRSSDKNKPAPHKLPFLKRRNYGANSVCNNAVQNDRFVILTSNEPMHISSSEVVEEEVFNKSNITSNRKPRSTLIDETIQVPGIEGGVNVIRCATINGRSLYVENGFHQHEYFIFKEVEDVEGYKIELSLFAPNVKWSLGKNRMKLAKPDTYSSQLFNMLRNFEREFIGTQVKIPGRAKRDICQLQGMDRLKICSMVYQPLIYRQHTFQGTNFKQHYIREKLTYDDCKRDINVKFLHPNDEVEFKSINNHTVDLIPCAVNSEWNNPTFYVAASQTNSLEAFVFSSVVGNPEEFVVMMRLRYIHLFHNYPTFRFQCDLN